MPQLQHAGASIHYELAGSGPPLLLIAGIASDNTSWAPLVPLLEPHFRLIMPDNRGSGQTRYPGTLNIGDIGDDCIAVLDHLGLTSAPIVGHSLGGMIGLRLASLNPGRVTKLVTLACSNIIGGKERSLFKDMAWLYPRVEPQLWFRMLFHWLFASPDFFEEDALAAAAEASTRYAHRQSPRDFALQVHATERMRPAALAGIRCPVLALAADHDLLVPPHAVASGHAGIARLETGVIAGAGHSVHWEASDAVADAIRRFLG